MWHGKLAEEEVGRYGGNHHEGLSLIERGGKGDDKKGSVGVVCVSVCA